jgi:acylglycerol lipase
MSESSSPLGILQPAGFPSLPEGWTTEVSSLASADRKAQLFLMGFHKSAASKGAHRALLVVHGMGEHGGRYLHLPYYLESVFSSVYCIDQRGHGRSEGIRGHCDRFTQYTDDLAEVITRVSEELKARYGQIELHVLGHSFGGLVVLRTHFLNATLPVKTVIASAPLLGVRLEVPAIKRLAGIGLSKIWGSLHMSNEVDASVLSHDPEVGKAYLNDRLVHNKVTPRFYTEMMAALSDTVKRDSGFPYPLLMIVPIQDKLVDADASLRFYKNLKIRDKQMQTYPGFFHESMNELGKEKVFEDIAAWIKNHSAL